MFSIDIKLSDEGKCINLFYSLLDSRDSLVIAIGRNTTTLKLIKWIALIISLMHYQETCRVGYLIVRYISHLVYVHTYHMQTFISDSRTSTKVSSTWDILFNNTNNKNYCCLNLNK